MVNNVMSLTGNGFKDWWIQRISAIVIAAYSIFMFLFLLTHPGLQYDVWKQLFDCIWVQIATVITLLAFLAHAWIGIWTVTTDYIKCALVRGGVQWAVIFFLLAQFLYGMKIIWG